MIIGPFWSEQNDSWVRIVVDKDEIYAEMAKRSKEQEDLASAWVRVENQDYWVINYKENEVEPFTEGLRLLKGRVYRTDFTKSKLINALLISAYDNNGEKKPHNTNQFNPFEGIESPQPFPITSYEKLPLTQEAQSAREEELKEEQRKILGLAKLKWQEWIKQDHRAQLEHSVLGTFTLDQTASLYDYFATEITELSAANYESVEQYSQALYNAIADKEDPNHKKIVEVSARTAFDREQHLNPNNEIQVRNDLYQRKQAFMFEVLQAEFEELSDTFGIKMRAPEIKVEQLDDTQGDAGIAQRMQQQEEELQLGEINEQDTDLQRVIQLSLEQNDLLTIQHTVINAVTKYREWYTGEKDHRGPNGFFSWLRHGSYGQVNAKKLQDAVLVAGSLAEAKVLVNSLLTHDDTRYHRHSLSSFLLDELVKLNGSEWSGLVVNNESNRYDKEKVIEKLSPHVGALNNN